MDGAKREGNVLPLPTGNPKSFTKCEVQSETTRCVDAKDNEVVFVNVSARPTYCHAVDRQYNKVMKSIDFRRRVRAAFIFFTASLVTVLARNYMSRYEYYFRHNKLVDKFISVLLLFYIGIQIADYFKEFACVHGQGRLFNFTYEVLPLLIHVASLTIQCLLLHVSSGIISVLIGSSGKTDTFVDKNRAEQGAQAINSEEQVACIADEGISTPYRFDLFVYKLVCIMRD